MKPTFRSPLLWLVLLGWIPFTLFTTSPLSSEEIAAKTRSSVVVIKNFAGVFRASQGSGFYVDAHTIATNYHVVEDTKMLILETACGETTADPEDVIFQDPQVDLAIIRVSETCGSLRLAPESEIQLGETLYAFGSPEGLQGTFSNGLLSAIRKFKNGEMLYQISAPISHGSSGGPVLDSRGRVVGMVTASLSSGQNLNFAVPSRYISQALSEVELTSRRPIREAVRQVAPPVDSSSTQSSPGILAAIFYLGLCALLGESIFGIARKMRQPVGRLKAYLPLFNLGVLGRAAGVSRWTLVGCLVPVLNVFCLIDLAFALSSRFRVSTWTAIWILIPGANVLWLVWLSTQEPHVRTEPQPKLVA